MSDPIPSCIAFVISVIAAGALHAQPALLDNNLKVADLRWIDPGRELPLKPISSTQILWQTEDWEIPTEANPGWPSPNGLDSVGYPTVVRNDRGPGADGKYYLYYAHHDPSSGIGVAAANSIQGPYTKLADLQPNRPDSQVLINPHHPAPPGDPSHYSSPAVVWNEDTDKWHMYFHFYNHMHGENTGYQLTGLATTSNLASHTWTPLQYAQPGTYPPPGWDLTPNPDGSPRSWLDSPYGTTPQIIPVLPTTTDSWIDSQSSYHAVQRLPDGRWLAFLRGTDSAANQTRLGFATSIDGIDWDYFAENPIIHQNDGGGGRQGVYRPGFVGYLGEDDYLLAWAESVPTDGDPRVIYGRTNDFTSVTRDPRGFAEWLPSDGPVSTWRENDRLYLFAGKYVHEMILPQTRGNWSFDESSGPAIDSSSYNRTATLQSGAVRVASTPTTGNAVDLNGDGAGISYGPGTDYGITHSLTLSAWVNVDSLPSGETMIFGIDPTIYGLTMYQNGRAYAYVAGGANNLSTPLTLDTWHHLALTYDESLATDNMNLYLDGVLVGSRDLTAIIDATSVALQSGLHSPGAFGTTTLDGLIDAARIHNYALTSSEVADSFFNALLAGDADFDWDVDLSDLSILASCFGDTSGTSWSTGDFDRDGDVDLADLSALAANYGASTAQAYADFQSLAAIPEPAAGALLLTSLGLLQSRVRRC